MTSEARDNSDKYTSVPAYVNSYVELLLTWESAMNIEVSVTIKDIPGGHVAQLYRIIPNPDEGVDYEYLYRLVQGGNILAPHDQSFPIYHLSGTPKAVRAGFDGQQATSRAGAVAL